MSKNNFHVGDEVVFVASNMHECGSQWYPEVGIIGVIKEVYELDNDGLDTRVQWPEGTTSAPDLCARFMVCKSHVD